MRLLLSVVARYKTHLPTTFCPYNTIHVGAQWEGPTPIISFIISECVDDRLAFLHGFHHLGAWFLAWFRVVQRRGTFWDKQTYPEFVIRVPGSWPGSGWFRLISMGIMLHLFNIGVWLIFCVAAGTVLFCVCSISFACISVFLDSYS